jgi:hypothetical protein
MDDFAKRNAIIQEFTQAGVPPNQPLSSLDLYRILDTKSVRKRLM